MRMTGKIAVVSMLVCVALMVGCSKQVTLTVFNHSATARNIQVTIPEGTRPVGSVSAGGMIIHTVEIKNKDLPAVCNCTAGAGASQSFTIDDETRSKLWFHITKDGALAGPYDKDSVHTETGDPDVDIKLRSDPQMIVR
jgi:hypothetical protein